MKRTAIALLAVLVTTSAFAGQTKQYLVGTSRAARPEIVRGLVRDAAGAPREVEPFVTFDGFAADLTAAEVRALRANPAVRFVEPAVMRYAQAQPLGRNVDGQTVPYGIDALHAPQAWQGQSSGPVNVVVIDTGIDFNHPDLSGAYAGGKNFVTPTSDPFDDADVSHGTHVSGTITAANNAVGVVGVAPNVKLWAAKVLDSTGSGTSVTIISALDWVVQQKAALGGNWVVNMSLGSTTPSVAEREACQRVADAGIIIVAAAGNESTADKPAPLIYPAAYSSVLAVGAIDADRKIADFSDQGPEIDVVAPGVSVLSTLRVGSGSLAYVKYGATNHFGSALTGSQLGTVTGQYVYCGLGNPSEIPSSVAGKIALIKRGDITFAQKAKNAKTAGAIGVAIFNKDDSSLSWTLISADDPSSSLYPWPVTIGLTREDGEALVAAGSGTITLVNTKDDYGYLDGTSMATPHVTGAIALLWSLAPQATPAQLVNALESTAFDLGAPGFDPVYGFGAINVFEAAKVIALNTFPPSALHPSTGRRYVRHH